MDNSKIETNHRRKFDLTADELKKVKGYENISEEEALETLDSIKEFCLLFYDFANSEK
jgi:hypothetical protein